MANPAVLIVAYCFPPLQAAGVFRMLRFVQYLPESGWQPVVVAAHPLPREPEDPSLMARVPRGLEVTRVPMWDISARLTRVLRGWRSSRQRQQRSLEGTSRPPARRRAGLLRTLDDLLFQTPDAQAWWFWPAVRASLAAVRTHAPRVILTSGPPHSVHLVGVAVSRVSGVPLVLDFRDPWARTPWGPRKANRIAQAVLRRCEALAVRAATRVVLNTARLASEFREAYPHEDPEKFVVLPNGFDPEMLQQVRAGFGDRTSVRNRSEIRLLHAGSLYKNRGPGGLLEALAALVGEGLPLFFEQLGQCDPEWQDETVIARLGLAGRAVFTSRVGHTEAMARLAEADVLVLIQPDTALQVPGKLFEMLLFDKPILALAGDGETADIVREFDLGVVAPPNDPAAIAAAIRRAVVRCQQPRSSEGRLRALEAFDGQRLTHQLGAVLDAAASRPLGAARRPHAAEADEPNLRKKRWSQTL